MMAAKKGRLEAVEALVAAGASKDIVDNKKRDLQWYIRKVEDVKIKKMLTVQKSDDKK